MLARIEDIESFEVALRWMQTGQSALWIGMLVTLVTVGLGIASLALKDERLTHAARRMQYALLLVTVFCCALLYLAIFNGYYFVNYVSHVTENAETLGFKISALWASQQGSLLFWCLILTLFSSAFAFSQRHNRTDRRLPWTLIVLGVVQFFFFFIMVSPTSAEAAQRSSPFAMSFFFLIEPDVARMTIAEIANSTSFRAPESIFEIIRGYHEAGVTDVTLRQIHDVIMDDPAKLPAEAQQGLLLAYSDGSGLNPALHNYWIAIHPPMLYLGFVGFTVPFAYAVGSLLSGEVNEGWLKPIRLWTMASWGFLTVGIALGGLWAYEILGWGGYWAWDPVENASFIPWLTATAFIHSVIVSERRGLLRSWSFALIIITYCMTVIGTFLVRSGIINSVHAFGATGDVDKWFYGFFGIVFVGSLLALVWRLPLLKSDRKLDSLFSREGSFLFNNLIFLAIALTTLVITFWPWITKQLYGENGSVELGQEAFVMINVPMLLIVLLLMGVGPALAWRRNNLSQAVRAFLAPTVAAVIVGVLNFIALNGSGLLVETGKEDAIANAAAWVRWTVQVTLWPICVFTLLCVAMEFASGAKARAKGTGENRLVALLRVTLGNRRRYGGYIVHIGVLLVALGIYYSSFYENEGTVVTDPGGYSVLDDKLTGDRFLVYYEDNDRTRGWNFLTETFGDEQRAGIYSNMLRYVRRNPDKSADEIIQEIISNQRQAMGGELPPQFREGLPRMSAAIAWGKQQQEREVVYEEFVTTLRIFPYTSPEVDVDPYLGRYSEVQDMVLTPAFTEATPDDEREAAEFAVNGARIMMQSGQRFFAGYRALRNGVRETDTGSLREAGLITGGTDDEDLERMRGEILKYSARVLGVFNDLAVDGIALGAELQDTHRAYRRELARLDAEEFARRFHAEGAGPEEVAEMRFALLKQIEVFQGMIESAVVERRNEIVKDLALDINDDESREKLKSFRPLSLAGLRSALEDAEGDAATLIQSEIDTILEDATTVHPQMRLFYDKRSGEPRMDEPVKDPYYYRTLGRDVYFILQDSEIDGTATLRFFVKPQMTLGMAGLVVIVLGTALAILPRFRRRRPEVA